MIVSQVLIKSTSIHPKFSAQTFVNIGVLHSHNEYAVLLLKLPIRHPMLITKLADQTDNLSKPYGSLRSSTLGKLEFHSLFIIH